ncbi:MAG: hypothetical protein ACK4N5_00070, partial [Myxococcales bacterium]
AESLPVESRAVEGLMDLDRDGWFTRSTPTPRHILAHMRRILDADLSRPVILDADGSLMDGAHRVCKALLLGVPALPTVRFPQTPPPTWVEPL